MKFRAFGVAVLLVLAGIAVAAAPVLAASQITITNNTQSPHRVAIYKKPVIVPKLQHSAPRPTTRPGHH
jgi:hypothetical protein